MRSALLAAAVIGGALALDLVAWRSAPKAVAPDEILEPDGGVGVTTTSATLLLEPMESPVE